MSTSKNAATERAARHSPASDEGDDVFSQEDQERSRELRREIQQTRADMGRTLEAIKERLAPDNLRASMKEEVKEQLESATGKIKETISDQYREAKATVREATIGRVEHMMHSAGDTMNEARETVAQTVRRNPIPAAMIGIGLGWLLMSARGQRMRSEWRSPRYRGGESLDGRNEYGYPRGLARGGRYPEEDDGVIERVRGTAGDVAHRAEDAASQVAHAAGNMAHHTQERVGALAHRVEDRAQEMGRRARWEAQRLEHRLEDSFYDNPLALGALAIAAGAAVGLALPQTRRENEWIGEARDQLVDKARDAAQTALERVGQAAEQMGAERADESKEQRA